MAHPLTPKEIYERMQELRNMKKLHAGARERVKLQDQLIAELEENIALKDEMITTQGTLIRTLELRVEELGRMLFGKKKKPPRDTDDDEQERHGTPPHPRSKDSFKRPIPKEEEVTTHTDHPVGEQCGTCGTAFTEKRESVTYEEDIVLPGNTPTTPLKTVEKHTVEWGFCPQCKRWRTLAPPRYASVVLGRAL